MDRIRELLAKGIGNLTDEELAELSMLLAFDENAETGEVTYPEGSILRDLTGDELGELTDVLMGAADERLDVDNPDDRVVAELEHLANGLDAIGAENGHRENAQQETRNRRDDLERRIRGGDGEDAPVDETPPEEPPADDTGDGDETAPEGELAPVTAGGSPLDATHIAPNTRPRVPAHRQPPAAPRAPRVTQAAVVAAAAYGNVAMGRRLDTPALSFRAWSDAVDMVEMSGTPVVRMPVARTRVEIPDELQLTMNAEVNEEKIARRTSLEAITASGGICAPVPYRYDLPTFGEGNRPVRDALARFGAQRGGVRTFVPPTIADVSGAFGIWTAANDVAPSAPATKPVLVFGCNNTEVTTNVYAVTQAYQYGVFRERWYPEQINALQDLMNVYHARYAESKNLAGIAAINKTVTYNGGGAAPGTVLLDGARDCAAAIQALVRGIKYRHRLPDSTRFRVIGFEWVRDLILLDLVRSANATIEEGLGAAMSAWDSFCSSLGVNMTWSPDYQDGQTGTNPGAPFAGTQATSTMVIGWPQTARFYVFVEGTWLFLDGGELNLGAMRDVGLTKTNDLMFFSETFENVHYHGLPGETYNLDVRVCPNGAAPSAAATISCP